MWKCIVPILFFVASCSTIAPQQKADPSDLTQYVPIDEGVCQDVNLPCVRGILKTTDFYFFVFKNSKLVAITKMSPDGHEITVWGVLPPKVGEHQI